MIHLFHIIWREKQDNMKSSWWSAINQFEHLFLLVLRYDVTGVDCDWTFLAFINQVFYLTLGIYSSVASSEASVHGFIIAEKLEQ